MKPPRLKRNPSSAHTWTVCTAQPHYLVQHADKLPPSDTEYNREGDIAHKVVEHYFKEEAAVYQVKGYKPEMETHALAFRRFCLDIVGPNGTWWSERKVPLFYAPESNGYIDFSGVTAEGNVVICDYKYGQGVAVNAFENLQMAIYAVSLIHQEFGIYNSFNTVTMAIFQPRVRDGEKQSTWTLSYGELQQFVEERVMFPAADIQAKTNLKFSPNDKVCQFCPAKGFCGMEGYEPDFAYSGQLRAEAQLAGTPLEPLRKGLPLSLQKSADLSQSAIAKVVLQKKQIEKWLEDIYNYAMTTKVEGLKQVKSKGGQRYWRDEAGVREILLAHLDREMVLKEKLISPAQAEEYEHDVPKDVWEQVQKLIAKSEGGPVLAAADDPRPTYGQDRAAEWFEDETLTPEDWL